VGVGNVEARLVRSSTGATRGESPVLFGGVLGHQLRTVRPSTVALERGDMVLMATDGVRADFVSNLPAGGSARTVAARVMERSGKTHDDALVVAVRWLGR
jgi:phosphoserine phosphatase RsbX